MRMTRIEPSITIYDLVDGVEYVTVMSWRAFGMVLWVNWQLITILIGALVYGLEQPYGLAVRFWLISSFGLTAFAWLLCEPEQAVWVLIVVLAGVIAEAAALFGLWIDDNGGW